MSFSSNMLSEGICYFYWRLKLINNFVLGDEDRDAASFSEWRIKAGLCLILGLPWLGLLISRVSGMSFIFLLGLIVVINGLFVDFSVKYLYFEYVNKFNKFSNAQKISRDAMLIMVVVVGFVYFGIKVYECKSSYSQPEILNFEN